MNAYFTKSSRAVTFVAAVCTLVAIAATPAAAQTTYSYVGNPFTLFSCGPNSTNTGTLNCSTPGPNLNTSYLATDRVTGTLVLDSPLPVNMALQDVRAFPGFALTLNDGRHTVTNLIQNGMFAEVATGPNGEITAWRLIINTGGVANGGIATQNWASSVSDSGVLTCCPPIVQGDLARNSGNPGTWTIDTPPSGPAEAVADLIDVVAASSTGLTAGQVSGLTDKLNNALASINAGLNKQAINQINAFINSVQSNVKNGKMSASTGQALIDAANAIIAIL